MELKQLTEELVLEAFQATGLKPGKFDNKTEGCPLEAIAIKEGIHWTQVLECPSHDFINAWDNLSTGHWLMIDREPWSAPKPAICEGATHLIMESIQIKTEGGQRAIDLWNFLSDKGLITKRT